MKITRIFGLVGLVVLLIGVMTFVSQNTTLASQPEESEGRSSSVQAHGQEKEHVQISQNRGERGEGYYRQAKYRIEREDEEEDDERIYESDDDSDEREHSYYGSVPTPPAVTPPPAPAPAPAPSNNATSVSYSGIIQPILNQRCNSCHPTAGVNLSNYAGTKASVSRLPGMGQGYLTSAELQKLLTWIQQGSLNN